MYSKREIELAGMALYSYDYSDENRTGVPVDWALLDEDGWVNPATGFRAYVFVSQTSSDVVISYTGTRFDPEVGIIGEVDWLTNIAGGVGTGLFGTAQFGDAVSFFRDLMLSDRLTAAQKQSVVFTGHSLGGGMAEYMGVLFERPALGFAAAPFEFMAEDEDVLAGMLSLFGAETTHGVVKGSE